MSPINQCFEEQKGCYGYRRISLSLRLQGIIVNHKKVKRLMKVMRLFVSVPKAKYKSYQGNMNRTVKKLTGRK